jgi:hypothetical protein
MEKKIMKLTNKQVRSIILEELRQVLSENAAFFGNSFVEFKKRVDAGEPALQVAEEVLYRLGEGSTRIVYGFPDNSTIVLKVINTTQPVVDMEKGEDKYGFTKQHKLTSNQNEADLQMQQQYPGIFPKSYEVAKDFSWIVTERVEPMDHLELLSYFGLPSYVDKNLYKKIIRQAVNMVKDELRESSTHEIDSFKTFQQPEEPTRTQAPKHIRPQSNLNSQTTDDLVRQLVSNKAAKGILQTAAALQIPATELTAKNLGISTFGKPHVVILDASLWEDRQ